VKRLERDKLVSKKGRDFILTKTGKAAAEKAGAQQKSSAP
jgi:predicted transcriptional regulator